MRSYVNFFLPTLKEPRKYFNKFRPKVLPPRYLKMAINQDWNSVWPVAKTFNPSVIPLPIRQGAVQTRSKMLPALSKWANHEILKIPNFFHLSPTNITKQCAAIKKFCSPWPKQLDSDDKIEQHFPLEIISSDYCHASPTIRDARARVVSIRFKLRSLALDEHARDKIIRILDHRYNRETDEVTIEADACPMKSQNRDYAMYLLTACYFESWKTEDWEKLKKTSDRDFAKL